MRAVDLIIDGINELRGDEELEEQYSDAFDEDGEPVNVLNDIEIENFYILPIEAQLKTQGKLLCEAIYGVKVRVNREVRLWRANTATFEKGIIGDGDINAITAKKVAKGTELCLSLFELFYHVCDKEHGLSVKVADTDELANFTMRQGRYAEGSQYPEMILRFSDWGIKERSIVNTKIDEFGVVLPEDADDTVVLIDEAQVLLDEVYPNNMFNKCKDIEAYIESNIERFKGIMRLKAQESIIIESEIAEAMDDGSDIDEEAIRVQDEAEYFASLYGDGETEGVLESVEDIVDYKAYYGNDTEDDDEYELDLAYDIEQGNYDYIARDNKGYQTKIDALPVSGGVMSEEVGREINEELSKMIEAGNDIDYSQINIGIGVAQQEMNEAVQQCADALNKERERYSLGASSIKDTVIRVRYGIATREDERKLMQLIALAYRAYIQRKMEIAKGGESDDDE